MQIAQSRRRAALREAGEQAALGTAVERLGLASGCFVYPAGAELGRFWVEPGADSRAALARQIGEAVEIGKRIRSRHIALLAAAEPASPPALQRRALIENLAHVAPTAAAAGMVLCIEPVNARRLPQMLLHHILDGDAVVRTVDSEAVRLVFDYGHVQAMDGDILFHLDQVCDEVEIVQACDDPGRVEPGAGELFARRRRIRASGGVRLDERSDCGPMDELQEPESTK